jgi:integrase/recombinase XerD
MLRGKTGERRVRIISFSKLLQQWLEVHPLRCKNHYPIWISEATNFKNNALGLRGAEKIIEAMPRSGLSNKHARASYRSSNVHINMQEHLTEAQMCTFFGWVLGTQVVRRYVHLSGKDVDNVLLALNEGSPVNIEENKLKSLKCKRCAESVSPTMNFCSKCALPMNLNSEYTREMDLEKENRELSEKVEQGMQAIRTEMNKRLS